MNTSVGYPTKLLEYNQQGVCNISHMSSVKSFFNKGHKRSYPSGQILLYQGESSRDVFYIQSGYVKVYDINNKGEEKMLLLLGKGDMFPLIWTFKQTSSLLYFYEALDDVEISVMPRDPFESEIRKNHEFSIELLQYFVNRTKELMNRLESIEGASALHKVGQVLAYLAENHSVNKGTLVVIQPTTTHQLIADLAGLTRETVSIQMKHYEENGVVIKKDDQLAIDCDKLLAEK
jgi:CRP/FNR family transcriptional regulator, cyclic AMP receptor protein